MNSTKGDLDSTITNVLPGNKINGVNSFSTTVNLILSYKRLKFITES